MKHTAAFLSTREDWETPQALFDHLNDKYRFTLDAAASPENAKCPNYYTVDDDALSCNWDGVVWCNPPYSHGIGKWVEKARLESVRGATVVMLIPARTDTRWFHRDVFGGASQLYFISGRLRFSGSDVNAPFPSCVAVFGGATLGSAQLQIGTMSRSGEILGNPGSPVPCAGELSESECDFSFIPLRNKKRCDVSQDNQGITTHAHPAPSRSLSTTQGLLPLVDSDVPYVK